MAILIYALCALAAFACAVLLVLGARRTRSRMLFWSGLCFVGLALVNLMVVVAAATGDPGALWNARLLVALGAVALLLYGLIVEER
jgi:hypothetical protein